ncbi:MAG: hypothetical protein R6V84_07740 [Desulfobacterales bacterium]
MKTREPEISNRRTKVRLEDSDHEFDDAQEDGRFSKSKIECICPGCGKMHVMKMNWIGRGAPRKFCQSCRDRETPLEDDG